MASVGPSYFYEDQVYRINKNGEMEFGIVTENWEMYSSEEDEVDSDQEKVPHGHVAVTWYPKNKDEVIMESKVKLGDRSLMPGDVVRRLIAGKDTQRGYCRSVRVSADVQVLGTKKVIPAVLASNLSPVQKLQPDVAVYLNSWIGVIRDVKYLLTLKFSDNSVCVVDSEDLEDRFEDSRKNSDGYGVSDMFYPGQKLRGPMKCLKDADYSYISDDMKRAKDRKIVTVLVTDVQPVSLNVQWQWQTPGLPGEDKTSTKDSKSCPPSETVTGEDLKIIKCLNLFESCTVQLGDISFYTPTSKDPIIDRNEWKKLKTASFNRVTKPVEAQANIVTLEKKNNESNTTEDKGKEDNEDDYETLETTTVGESNNNKLASRDTSQNINSGNSKKLKVCTRSLRKKKLKKVPRQQPTTEVVSETQTVVETLYTQSVVDVVWQDGTYEEGMLSIDLYPIHHLDDHEFFPGDFVAVAESNDFRKYGVIQKMDHAGRVAVVKWFEAYSFTGHQKPKEMEETEMSVYDLKDHPDFRFRPGTIVIRVANVQDLQYPAGQIVDNYPDGQVRVWWANGDITPCWPQDLFRLGDYDSDEGEIWDDHRHSDSEDAGEEEEDEANSDSSWETETEEDQNDTADNLSERYQTIGRLIERIQKTLVSTREAIVANSSVSLSEESDIGVASPIAKLVGFDERSLTKKLLLIYKDCQYLDKIMGTKYFDVEDLKKWHKHNENATVKSRRIVEQISRFFDSNREDSPCSVSSKEDIEAKAKDSQSSIDIESQGEKTLSEETNPPGMLLFELCSVILSKLVEAHSEYEKRFGSFKNEQTSSTDPLLTEAIAECLGGNTFKSLTISENESEAQTIATIEAMDVEISPSTQDQDTNFKNLTKNDKEQVEDNAVNISVSHTISESRNFNQIDSVPDTHRYRLTTFQPQNQRIFIKTVQKEVASLRESLPDGILVKGFEDRMDLYSVMIKGPEKTPYEDGLFLFDIHLPPAYSSVPPMVHYIAFCTDRLNPNLYEEGKVCVSLLGTWNGKGTEVWTSNSSLLQLLVSVQGLILGPEPYYNEAGYEKQKGSQQGAENSRMYNENVLIKLVQSLSRMIANPPAPWQKEVIQHIKIHGPRLIERYTKWLALSASSVAEETELPGFSLLPVSKGFSITLKKTLISFGKLLESIP